MKVSKLIEKLNRLILPQPELQKHQVKKLRQVLSALKDKEEHFLLKLECTEDEEERRKILQKIEVIRLQRSKGVQIYKSLKREREQASRSSL